MKKAEAVVVVRPVTGVAAVVLAAGSSQRMGAVNKLHLPIDGVPLLRRSVQTLLDAGIEDIVVVLGYDHEKTRALIDDLPLCFVVNTDHRSGQMSSVHRGLNSLDGDYQGIIVGLGDQPALHSADINFLIDSFVKRSAGEVVVPTYQGKRGNPIVISASCREDILSGKRNLGCRKFIEKNPELVHKIEMSNPGVITDLDTPQEYQKFCASLSDRNPDNLTRQAS